jgi:hypothetical protein
MANAKSTTAFSTTRFAVVVLGGAALTVASVWGVTRVARRAEAAPSLPKEYTVEALKAKVDDPGAMMGTVREAMRSEELTDEQRRELMGNMREVWRQTMLARVDEYYSAPPEEQVAVLDRHIDRFVEQMKQWEERRKELEKNGELDRERMGQMFTPPTQQERKERSENRNPDQLARTMAYFMAAQSRMSERGIKMPGGFGGRGMGGGGPGAGRRGGP